jgi:hypothetical protein
MVKYMAKDGRDKTDKQALLTEIDELKWFWT